MNKKFYLMVDEELNKLNFASILDIEPKYNMNIDLEHRKFLKSLTPKDSLEYKEDILNKAESSINFSIRFSGLPKQRSKLFLETIEKVFEKIEREICF